MGFGVWRSRKIGDFLFGRLFFGMGFGGRGADASCSFLGRQFCPVAQGKKDRENFLHARINKKKFFFSGACFFGWGINFVKDYLSGFLTLVFDVGFGVWRLMGDGVWVF